MKMILHQNITMHFHPVAFRGLSKIAQKLRPISIIPEYLFPVFLTKMTSRRRFVWLGMLSTGRRNKWVSLSECRVG